MADIRHRHACLGVLLALFAASPAHASKHGKKGAVLLKSPVVGALVKVDGKSLGVTPLKPQALSAGAHILSIKKNGYQTLVRRLIIREGATEVVQADLLPASAATGATVVAGTVDLVPIPVEARIGDPELVMPPLPPAVVAAAPPPVAPIAPLPSAAPAAAVVASNMPPPTPDFLKPAPVAAPGAAPVVEVSETVDDDPWYEQWWVWSAAGVVVAGSGVLAWSMMRDAGPDTHATFRDGRFTFADP
jgi:hypothetical protein